MPAKTGARSFDVPHDAPDIIRAASLGLALLKRAGADDFEALDAGIRTGNPAMMKKLESTALSRADLRLLTAHRDMLAYLRATPATHILYCHDCHEYAVITGAAPSRCFMTDGCESKNLTKSTQAKLAPRTHSG